MPLGVTISSPETFTQIMMKQMAGKVSRFPSAITLASRIDAILQGLKTVEVDQKIANFLFLITFAQALRSAPVVAKQRKEEENAAKAGQIKCQRLPSFQRLQDHTVVSWLLGNMGVWLAFTVQRWVQKVGFEISRKSGFAGRFATEFLVGNVTFWGVNAYLLFLVDGIYAHIPSFSKDAGKETSFLQGLQDWSKSNLIIQIFFAVLRSIKRPGCPTAPRAAAFRPTRFIFRLAILRFVFDAVFWAGHKAMHSYKRLWFLHRFHHDHKNVSLMTNFHFDWYDLVFESALPLLTALGAVNAISSGRLSKYEAGLLVMYNSFYLGSSHAGKALPTMNVIPPLAPWFQRYDDKNCYSHASHHSSPTPKRVIERQDGQRDVYMQPANLSTSHYFDQLMGTDYWA